MNINVKRNTGIFKGSRINLLVDGKVVTKLSNNSSYNFDTDQPTTEITVKSMGMGGNVLRIENKSEPTEVEINMNSTYSPLFYGCIAFLIIGIFMPIQEVKLILLIIGIILAIASLGLYRSKYYILRQTSVLTQKKVE